jgi:hypothetical protein
LISGYGHTTTKGILVPQKILLFYEKYQMQTFRMAGLQPCNNDEDPEKIDTLESGNPEQENWIPGQARNDGQDSTFGEC